MKLSRERAGRDASGAKEYRLIDSPLRDPSDYYYPYQVPYSSSDPFSLRVIGFDERDEANTSYSYSMTFTQREMKILLSRYLDIGNVPANEKKLLEVLLDLWEKRLKRREQRERKKRISN